MHFFQEHLGELDAFVCVVHDFRDRLLQAGLQLLAVWSYLAQDFPPQKVLLVPPHAAHIVSPLLPIGIVPLVTETDQLLVDLPLKVFAERYIASFINASLYIRVEPRKPFMDKGFHRPPGSIRLVKGVQNVITICESSINLSLPYEQLDLVFGGRAEKVFQHPFRHLHFGQFAEGKPSHDISAQFGCAGMPNTVHWILNRGHAKGGMPGGEGLAQKAFRGVLRIQDFRYIEIGQKRIQIYPHTTLVRGEIRGAEILEDVVRHHLEETVSAIKVDRVAGRVAAVDQVAIVVWRRRQGSLAAGWIPLCPLIVERVSRKRKML